MKKTIRLLCIVMLSQMALSFTLFASEPISSRVYKYGLILDTCVLDGKELKKERPGDWGYYVTISHGVEFGSDIDSRWLRVEFQYFKKTKDAEFTIYSSTASRIGKWEKVVTFRKKIEKKDMVFKYAETWQAISFDNDDLQIKFKFFLKKAK